MLKFQEYEKDKKIKAIGKESEVIDDDKSFLYLIRQKVIIKFKWLMFNNNIIIIRSNYKMDWRILIEDILIKRLLTI